MAGTCSLKIFIWIQIIFISSEWLVVAAKPLHSFSKVNHKTTNYNLQDIDDDALLTTDTDLDQHNSDNNLDHKLITGTPTTHLSPPKVKQSSTTKQSGHKIRRPRTEELAINRRNPADNNNDDDSDLADDYDHIQSKDESEDEDDVQLIIIPKKPRKKLRPKIQDSENEDSENSITDPDENSQDLDKTKESKDHRNSQDLEKAFKKLKKKLRAHKAKVSKDEDDDDDDDDDENSISLERVSERKGNREGSGDYDLHVKVKDNSGTNVKLSGDLPGNIGKLVAEGEGGGKVQVQNSKNKESKAQSTEEDNTAASTDDIAEDVIKTREGKIKHAPYSSAVLLKSSNSELQDPDGTVVQNNREKDTVNQEMSVLKSEDQDKYLTREVSKAILRPPNEHPKDDGIKKLANQQPGTNAFSEMELDNADDEMVATSRLLEIARKADDESALKDTKDSPNTKTSTAASNTELGKPKSLTSENVKKRISLDDVDKESDNNWYKMQSLEDRVVREGDTAKNGETVGNYNGQDVSVLTHGQLQLLQTEYPSYPAYLTPLLKNKLKDDNSRQHEIIKTH